MSRQRLSDCCTVRVMVMVMAMVDVMVMLTNQANLLQVPLLDEPRKSRNSAARRFPSSRRVPSSRLKSLSHADSLRHVAHLESWNPRLPRQWLGTHGYQALATMTANRLVSLGSLSGGVCEPAFAASGGGPLGCHHLSYHLTLKQAAAARWAARQRLGGSAGYARLEMRS